ALAKGWPARFLVVGLGLGYIEWMIFAKCYAKKVEPHILSLESDPYLTGQIYKLVTRDYAESQDMKVFEDALAASAAYFGEPGLREMAFRALSQERWKIGGTLDAGTEFERRSSVILYDPFSKRTSPELWEQAFLESFLMKAAGNPCVFSTYASHGQLKRALAAQGFSQEPRPGFGGKRESTLATFEKSLY
ncbi:MAG TPA: MnmC family methyltransferase, partial [Bdellovibrionales bacterium]|nr:MnmC family methyltransferase [Bdellovibrionales bacterium]